MSSGPENQPSPSPSPKPSTEQELRVAIAKAHLGGKEVSAGSDHWIAGLENAGDDHLKTIKDETSSALLGKMLTFEPTVIARKVSDEGHSVVFSPLVRRMHSHGDHEPGGYLIPPWQELHPEIGEILRRGTDTEIGGPKHQREMEFHAYKGSQLDIVRSPIAILVTDQRIENAVGTPVGAPSIVVLWSKAAFIECSEGLISQFAAVQKGAVVSSDSVNALKLGRGRSWEGARQSGPAWLGEIPLPGFLERCPSYLSGLIAYESVHKAVRETLASTDSPDIAVTGVRFRENWNLEVKFKFGQEERELVISPHLPERLSFSWADEDYGVANLASQWLK